MRSRRSPEPHRRRSEARPRLERCDRSRIRAAASRCERGSRASRDRRAARSRSRPRRANWGGIRRGAISPRQWRPGRHAKSLTMAIRISRLPRQARYVRAAGRRLNDRRAVRPGRALIGEKPQCDNPARARLQRDRGRFSQSPRGKPLRFLKDETISRMCASVRSALKANAAVVDQVRDMR